MPQSKFETAVRQEILQCLELHAHTVTALEVKTGRNYYTLRKYLNNMKDEGIVHQLFTGSAKNIKWALGSDNSPNNIMPSIEHDKGRDKVLVFMGLSGDINPDNRITKAITALGPAVAKLMTAAYRAHNNEIDPSLTISTTRAELEGHAKSVENYFSILTQMLNDSRLWNPELLKRFPLDAEWDDAFFQTNFAKHFKTEVDE